jgi:hypothetical protein
LPYALHFSAGSSLRKGLRPLPLGAPSLESDYADRFKIHVGIS